MKAELCVQSPCLGNRSVNFLRYSKLMAEKLWAVMDVSTDSMLEPPGSHFSADPIANNTGVPAWCTGCRLLPSGCLIEDMGNGYCKVGSTTVIITI